MEANVPNSPSLADHLVWTLRGGYAHDSFEGITSAIEPADRGRTLPGVTHSPWQIVEHLRICQRDLIEYTRRPGHVSPEFPDGLWPREMQPASEQAWDDCVAAYLADREELAAIITRGELTQPLPHIEPATPLRQVLIAIDHQSYHLGQLAVLAAALADA